MLHVRHTTVAVLAPELGKTKTGQIFVIVPDERPCESKVLPAGFYLHALGRKGTRAEALLAGDDFGWILSIRMVLDGCWFAPESA